MFTCRCAALMRAQGHEKPNGRAKVTRGHNLPAAHVIHTVGPVVRGIAPTARDRADFAACSRSCLELAYGRCLRSVAFCCISTGAFRFPRREAARVAVRETRAFLDAGTTSVECVVFNVFKDDDLAIYHDLLG